MSETTLLTTVQSSLLSNSERELVRVPLNHSYLCPLLGPKYNSVAESVFPTSAWQVEMWVFQDVYGEEERDLVKNGMWTGEICMCSTQRRVHRRPLSCLQEVPGKLAVLLPFLLMPLSSINLTLPSSLVNSNFVSTHPHPSYPPNPDHPFRAYCFPLPA